MNLLSVLLAALLLGLAGCGESKETAKGALSGTSGQPAAKAGASGEAQAAQAQAATQRPEAGAKPEQRERLRTVVSVQPLKQREFTLSSTYIGYLIPRERVELRAELEGMVEQVKFDEGDAVQAGQLLANISTEQMRVRRDQARADLALAKSIHERNRNLYANKLVTDAQLEQSQTKLDLATFTARLAEIELNKSSVKAPLSGMVKTRGVNRGEFVNKGQLVAELLDVARVRAVFNVPEREIRYLRAGRRVDVTLEALPGESFPGAVRLVGLEADLKTRTFPVEVEVDNPQGRLRPGMLARVAVALEHYENQLMVPRYSILERENGRVVYVVAPDGTARERQIRVGSSSEGQVQVLEGLAPGELLVVAGQQKLTPGEPVDAKPVQP